MFPRTVTLPIWLLTPDATLVSVKVKARVWNSTEREILDRIRLNLE